MKITALILKLLGLAYLTYLTFFLLTGYHPEKPTYDPPFIIWIFDTINLFIHEAGHLFFTPFGMWMHIIAGSFFQVLIPAALLMVTYREKAHQVVLPGFWAGESMVNVSAYIKDAPHMKLKLIAQGLIHDWNYLIGGNRETAAFLGGMVFWIGVAVCAGAVGVGLWYSIRTYKQVGLARMTLGGDIIGG